MARCGECQKTFEGNRQPRCPFCGAVRPRPRFRTPQPPEPTLVALEMGVGGSQTIGGPRTQVLQEAPKMVDLEFAFGGPGDALVLPVTEFLELPAPGAAPIASGDERSAGIARLNAAFGRFRRARR